MLFASAYPTISYKLLLRSMNHITHLLNLKTILSNGLLSHNNPYKKVDISNIEVNDRRNKFEPIYNRNLHDYVPLYFNPRNAMLFRNQKEHGVLIIVLGFKIDLLLYENIVFTNGNAAKEITKYSNNINYLATLDWNSIRSDRWCFDGYVDYEIKSKMMTEVLVYEKVDINTLEVIYCQHHIVKYIIEQNYNLGKIRVEVNQNMFFRDLII